MGVRNQILSSLMTTILSSMHYLDTQRIPSRRMSRWRVRIHWHLGGSKSPIDIIMALTGLTHG